MSVLLCRDSRHSYSAVSASEDFFSILRYINVHITLHYITLLSVYGNVVFKGLKMHDVPATTIPYDASLLQTSTLSSIADRDIGPSTARADPGERNTDRTPVYGGVVRY